MFRFRNPLRGPMVTVALIVLGACSDGHVTDAPGAAPATPRANAAALASVNFRVMIDTITGGIIQDSTGLYVVPTTAVLDTFRLAVDSVRAGRVDGADAMLDKYAYDVFRIVEDSTGDTLTVMRERIPAGGTVARGWGTYVFNPRFQNAADIHVNHPIDDQHSEDMAGDLYRSSRGRWFLMAGARRYANSNDAADMARQTASVFHTVHVRVAAAGTRAISVHGFRISNQDELPPDAEMVLSNGRNNRTSHPVYLSADSTLRTRLVNAGFVAGLFEADSAYQDLGATLNPQGRHSNTALGWGHWMHIEHERALRTDSVAWKQSNAVIRQWIVDFPAQ